MFKVTNIILGLEKAMRGRIRRIKFRIFEEKITSQMKTR